MAATSFLVGIWFGAQDSDPTAASRFTEAWAAQDFDAMYRELTPMSQQRFSREGLVRAYLEAQQIATAELIDPSEPRDPDQIGGREVVSVPVRIETRAFGEVGGELELPLEGGKIAWESHLAFPGLGLGEKLDRETRAPPRAPILTRDGTALARGPASSRSSPLGTAALDVAGETGAPRETEDADAAARAGFDPDEPVGTSGLERAFNERLGGKPGGELVAKDASGAVVRVLARSEPEASDPLRTTIEAGLQREAVSALGGSSGGVAVLDARTGAVRALAGAAFSAPQPPGSTFKIVTTVAALEADVVKLTDEFPIQQSAEIEGRAIDNAHEESCGGSFVQAFALSCNSVFAPLGPKVGGERLVELAEKFGFNSNPALYNERATEVIDPPPSTIPEEIGSELDLAVTAIGQGRLLATPLQMASIAQTIAAGGVRLPTPIVTEGALGPSAQPARVTSPAVARKVRKLMVSVVSSGTGRSAALPGTQVAGKTGTAELGPKAEQGQITGETGEEPEQDVDAWFAGFAPARRPRLVVAVMLVNAPGDGGEVAAPIARQVLAAGLR
jgi:cell division protein FtsI/penicillin-binding protein 2